MSGLFGPKREFHFWPLFGPLALFAVTDVTSVTRRWRWAKKVAKMPTFFSFLARVKTLKFQRKVAVWAKGPLYYTY
nr:MAG TPA: hypothetical protein [Caudoviricetes sp.]